MDSATPQLCVFLGRHESTHSGMWVYGIGILREVLQDISNQGELTNCLPLLVRYGGGSSHERDLELLLAALPREVSRQIYLRPLPLGNRLRRLGLFFDLFASCGGAAVVHGTANSIPPLGRSYKILTLHDLLQGYGPTKCCSLYSWLRAGFHRIAIRVMCRRVDLIVTDTPQIKDEIDHRLSVGSKMLVLNPGLERQFLESRMEQKCRATETLMAFVSRDRRKRLDLVLQGFSKLRDAWTGPGSLRLIVVAADEASGSGALQLARDLGLEELVEIRIAISTEELVELFQSVAALVFPSEAEGFGYPVYEALSQGTPVVCRSGLIPEVVCREVEELVLQWDGSEDGLSQLMLAACRNEYTLEQRKEVAGKIRNRCSFRRLVSELAVVYRRGFLE